MPIDGIPFFVRGRVRESVAIFRVVVVASSVIGAPLASVAYWKLIQSSLILNSRHVIESGGILSAIAGGLI